VPCVAISRTAEEQLRAMPELRGVRNELQVAAMQEPIPPPSQGQATSPGHAKIPTPPHQPAKARERNGRTRSILANNATPQSLERPVAILPPIAVPIPQVAASAPASHKTQAPTDLGNSFAAIRQQCRTQGLTLEVRDAVVYISGPKSRSDHVFALAQVVAEMPGVERVIVLNQSAMGSR
jgi:hypothetical protein